jgi:3-deoxy-D-manno-octulosonic-acid transferase
MILTLYRAVAMLSTPFLRRLLSTRVAKGKEIANRIDERFGHASAARPAGKIIWFHAASVGELQSILPLINTLLEANQDLHILVTTMTVTSAKRFDELKPDRCIHQFIPLDTPASVARFMQYWHPDAVFLTESEIWPNLIIEMKRSVSVCGIVNGRMSEKSFKKWNFFPSAIASLLSGLIIFAQSEKDAERYRKLGGTNVSYLGNLKFDAPALPFGAAEYQKLKSMIGDRPFWLAASTHPKEESEILEFLQPRLLKQFPQLLTIIVPRHPERGDMLSALCKNSALRSRQEPITQSTQVYIADTIGELGLFYRLGKIVFMGGSIIPHGGQNMLEPARLGCAVVWGEHVFNFEDAAYMMIKNHAGIQAKSEGDDLLNQLADLLANPTKAEQMGVRARELMESQIGIVRRVGDKIRSSLQQ